MDERDHKAINKNLNPDSLKDNVTKTYSLDEVRNIVTEMENEAQTGLYGGNRWDMQKRLGRIRDKWNLGY